jgi:soluble lytic murein transglycosylase
VLLWVRHWFKGGKSNVITIYEPTCAKLGTVVALRYLLALTCLALASAGSSVAKAQVAEPTTLNPNQQVSPVNPGDDVVVQAREALRKRDKAALAAASVAVNSQRHALAQWVDYWGLNNRLPEAQQAELDAFYARWPGTYVEDRLRNDWLLELGRRRDWANFKVEHPRFRMNDDREVTCYALLTQHLAGIDVHAAARQAWAAMRDAEDGCGLLGRTLVDAGAFASDDIWPVLRSAVEMNRPRAARSAAALLGPGVAQAVAELWDTPVRYLTRRPPGRSGTPGELALLAVMRMASSDPDAAAAQLEQMRDGGAKPGLAAPLQATAWAHVAKQAALRLQPNAAGYAGRAWQTWDSSRPTTASAVPWGDEVLAWHVRAALRQSADDKQRWPLVSRAISAMSPTEQREGSWVYWHARAQLAQAAAGAEGETARSVARAALQSIAPQISFYGNLAAEELGQRAAWPAPPTALTAAERDAARSRPGLQRALLLIQIGLRNEGVREWNFTMRGLNDRELLAAAQWACEREVYDRCISTSERQRSEVDVALRFPTPFRPQLMAQAQKAGLDPALLYGLIRQESRFVGDTRSHVGAYGLMQLMPGTAKWTAKKVGMDYRHDMLGDREVNLTLGSAYLKRLVDDFGGSLAMATAAYNAGPNRPRRWREGGTTMEPAAWAESIPFNETRDYVKKVLANSVHYAAVLGHSQPTLKSRLGALIGPALAVRDGTAGAPDRDLP